MSKKNVLQQTMDQLEYAFRYALQYTTRTFKDIGAEGLIAAHYSDNFFRPFQSVQESLTALLDLDLNKNQCESAQEKMSELVVELNGVFPKNPETARRQAANYGERAGEMINACFMLLENLSATHATFQERIAEKSSD